MRILRHPLIPILLAGLWILSVIGPQSAEAGLREDLAFFASIQDRSVGTRGNEEAADYILHSLEQMGLTRVGVQKFMTPVPEVLLATLAVNGQTFEIFPWGPNLAYLPKTPEGGFRGQLVHAGNGDLASMDGLPIKDSIVLLDMNSGGNWMKVAMLGARAVIYLGREDSPQGQFQDKNIPSPVAFPRFWASPSVGRQLQELASTAEVPAILEANTRWQNKMVRNVYGLLPGKDPRLRNELIIVDAFYDASSPILGKAPGADEASSVVLMLEMARTLVADPPDRSVLFLATTGNGQSLAGMRHFISAITARTKMVRRDEKLLKDQKKLIDEQIELLDVPDPFSISDPVQRDLIWQLVVRRAKDKADLLTREAQYRKRIDREGDSRVEDARPYRRLSWITSMDEATSPEARELSRQLLEEAKPPLKTARRELKARTEVIRSTKIIRDIVDDHVPILFLSLNLSSHSPFFGLVEMGDTYPVRERVRRMARATRLNNLMSSLGDEVSDELKAPGLFRDLSRSSAFEGGFGAIAAFTHPCCDVGALAGLPSVSLMTLDDYRQYWNSPSDTLDRVNQQNLEQVNRFLTVMLPRLFSRPELSTATEGGLRGLAGLEGRALFQRQGELFPDQPAPDTIVSVLEGQSVFRAMVHQDGTFFIPGLANSRAALEKLIIEPYGIDPTTGRVAWTADKRQTGKDNYRIKVKSDFASTTLVVFHCEQTDILPAFNPRNMGHLTKVNLLDAATEATPMRYWYSRVDGRDTMAISLFLERGTRFKLILSESLLSRDFFLLNNSDEDTQGRGFLIGEPPMPRAIPYQVAMDLHRLLGGRLANLSEHGISNRYLENLYERSSQQLETASQALDQKRYGIFWQNTLSAWATLNTIYAEAERTQRDVLTGVMFFIALFVPFAYCLERYLFAFRNVYKQIVAFFTILMTTIFVIKGLHPAFELTYSPMVVIVAFFIVGLSVMVSWIIFMRFEEEMADTHSVTGESHLSTPQVSKWQAFGAGFAIGVSNLNRRKLRTGLTCLTLIILTFTVMSFTNVRSLHTTTHTRIAATNPYDGILIRHQYRLPLTALTLEDMKTRFDGAAVLWPKGWIDPGRSSARALTRVCTQVCFVPVEGILGVGDQPPEYFRQIVTHGAWFGPDSGRSVLMPLDMAQRAGLHPDRDVGTQIEVMGGQFTIAGFFDGDLLESLKNLDQNPITPAYFELSLSDDLSEVEIEAMQSGEEILPHTDRFRYANANATLIMPFELMLYYGGTLKSITILPPADTPPLSVADDLATWLRFSLFVGDNGTFHHSASTTIRYQGVANLLVPILIVIFITLNTMIGHVHERQKEISIYTSVGLAPTHVGFLFIVEALSLAVLSTVIGYIIAQMSAKYLANTAMFSQLTFNYSSLSSVACMFLVFSVVFLAALYPARVAAEMAMPDVNRSWSLPEPQGDTLFMNLPFLLKQEEERGIMSFLSFFYKSHQDLTHGTFTVDELTLDEDSPEPRPGEIPTPACLLLRTNVWLAPFDFGIKQRLQLHCCPSTESPGYLEISIMMIRLSGEHSAWIRTNRNFIKSLRKQLLLWRLMSKEAKAVFTT